MGGAWGAFACCAACLVLAGCSSGDLNTVSGTVKLNGQPLPDATVTFIPVADEGSSAAGKTDSQGKYELFHAGGARGADVGDYFVSVSTYQKGDKDANPPIPAQPERVPAQFNVRTQISKKVEAGENVIDLDLTDAGK